MGNTRWRYFLCSSNFISKSSWNLNIDKTLNTAVSMIKTFNIENRLMLNGDASKLRLGSANRNVINPGHKWVPRHFKDRSKKKKKIYSQLGAISFITRSQYHNILNSESS